MKKIYIEYAELKEQEKALTAKIKEVNLKIQEDMTAKGETKIANEIGTFSLKQICSWTFTDTVDKLKAKLKKTEEKEKEEGLAKSKTSYSLTFNSPKNND